MKKLLLTTFLVIALTLSFAAPAFAADPITEVSVTWDGAGVVAGDSVVGSGWAGSGTSFAESHFTTGGTTILGSYTVTTQGKTTYDVWGDKGPTTVADFISSAVGGGAFFQNDRTGATPYTIQQHYPDSGQIVSAFADTGSGTGSVDFSLSSVTTYAGMSNTSGGFNADASDYTLWNTVVSGTGNSAGFEAIGDGTADIDVWHTSAGNGVNFGWGQGSFTDADVNNTGSGSFTVLANYLNGLQTEKTVANGSYTGWNLGGSGSFSQSGSYTNGAYIPNFSLAAW